MLANLFLIAFYALQASHPENGTWLGQRPSGITRDRIHDPCGACAERMVARPAPEPDHPVGRPAGTGSSHGGRPASGVGGDGVQSSGTDHGGSLDDSQSLAVPDRPMGAPVSCPQDTPGTARRLLGCWHPGRWRGRRARVLASLDVVAAAGGVRRGRTSRGDWHARNPGVVPVLGPTPRGVMTILAKSTLRCPTALCS